MVMYAIALAPFQKRLIHLCNQVWFADDASGCDTFVKMRMWFDELVALGPQYGYYPSADKCILVSKQSRLAAALESFKGTGVAVQLEGSKDTGVDALTTGARHLGAAVGTTAYQHEYISNKVKIWVDSVKTLARIAKSEPHAAYSAYPLLAEPVDVFMQSYAGGAQTLPAPRRRYSEGLYLVSF